MPRRRRQAAPCQCGRHATATTARTRRQHASPCSTARLARSQRRQFPGAMLPPGAMLSVVALGVKSDRDQHSSESFDQLFGVKKLRKIQTNPEPKDTHYFNIKFDHHNEAMCVVLEESAESIVKRFHRSTYTHFERSISESWTTTNLEKPEPFSSTLRNRRQKLKVVTYRKNDKTLNQAARKIQSIISKHLLLKRIRKAT